MIFALSVTERPCEHAGISDRTSIHLSRITFKCRGGPAPARHVTVTMMKCVGSQKHGSWQKTQRRPHMTSQEQPDARTEAGQTPHLPVKATALLVTSLFDTSWPWPDHKGAGPRDEVPRGPCPQKAGSHGSNPVERRSQIPEAAKSKDAIWSTATNSTGEARRSEHCPGGHGPSMQARSQQTSGKQQGAPRSQPLADESRGTWAGLAGRTRNEAEPRQQPPDEERHEELSLGAPRDQPVTPGAQPEGPGL